MANNNSRTSHESEVDGGIKRQKRGPFLPVNEGNDVGLLADNNDDDDDLVVGGNVSLLGRRWFYKEEYYRV